MSTPAEAFGSRWPLETVAIDIGDVVLEDQIVEEFEKIAGIGRDTLTGRVVELRWDSPDALVFKDAAGYRWRVNDQEVLIRDDDEITIEKDAKIEAVREVVPDDGRFIRKRLPCVGDCGWTEHIHVGENAVHQDVWRCNECGGTRAGPILSQSDVEPSIATDGGGR